ncbi:16S rRNA (cytosine(967)-C(5))-methyltransferase RsmB [Marinicella litoralis]|uniref:16S rRNA (cytosine(967)-C(5))-methyltransferase n=1 Tax=Marinicella litoralis TaxID=644220 RepID=A0A4V6PXZ6_9GAMM|nr:16S rRNA (cytosine(967)-C(5))-methyltransferase RsmB [Marinicella litoralis]TDR23321.1 16S rRNA m(5)C-967 methyltransferase [Marinicella litoralis]
MSQSRQVATQVLYQVVVKHQHLKQALHNNIGTGISDQDQAWIQHACYVSLRHHFSLQNRWQKFTDKPLKDKWVSELLTLSLCQKFHMSTPDHAIVDEAIRAAKKVKKNWASGLINKVLRLAMKDVDYKIDSEVIEFDHPQWWIDLLKKDWPEHYLKILQANNQKPPLWIRTVHESQIMPGQQHPNIKTAWLLDDNKASQSDELMNGQFSVQDAAAQLAAKILNPQAGEYILDACAAPGGKSCHLLEQESKIQLDILEKEPSRLKRVEDNLSRLNLSANRIILGDATKPEDWFEEKEYDKILLDVPCSAAGVVRRNPDIKLLRQAEHLIHLTQLQQQIINRISPLLKVGGQLLYATCSVFRSENERQIKKFLKANPNFSEIELHDDFAEQCAYGIQIITGTEQMDGFYYCLLQRTS